MKKKEKKLKPAVFLDRDGTIIELVSYLHEAEKVKLIQGAKEAIEKLNRAGFLVIIISNQSGIGRGYFSEKDLMEVTSKMEILLKPAKIDAIYHAPSSPEHNSEFRKPGKGMIEAACKYFNIDLKNSWIIGDNISDLQLAENMNIPFILVLTGYGAKYRKRAAIHSDSLVEAIDIILKDD